MFAFEINLNINDVEKSIALVSGLVNAPPRRQAAFLRIIPSVKRLTGVVGAELKQSGAQPIAPNTFQEAPVGAAVGGNMGACQTNIHGSYQTMYAPKSTIDSPQGTGNCVD